LIQVFKMTTITA